MENAAAEGTWRSTLEPEVAAGRVGEGAKHFHAGGVYYAEVVSKEQRESENITEQTEGD